MSERWWKDGIRFECRGRGDCCVSHGTSSWVYATREDRRRLAAHLGLATSAFTRRYCRPLDDRFVLRDTADGQACVFLERGRCGVYAARPTQCRTWPFWPELLENPARWREAVAGFCQGFGRGRLWSAEEIEAVAEEQRLADGQR